MGGIEASAHRRLLRSGVSLNLIITAALEQTVAGSLPSAMQPPDHRIGGSHGSVDPAFPARHVEVCRLASWRQAGTGPSIPEAVERSELRVADERSNLIARHPLMQPAAGAVPPYGHIGVRQNRGEGLVPRGCPRVWHAAYSTDRPAPIKQQNRTRTREQPRQACGQFPFIPFGPWLASHSPGYTPR